MRELAEALTLAMVCVALAGCSPAAPDKPERCDPTTCDCDTVRPAAELSNDEIIEIYAANQEEIDVIWIELGEGHSLRDATMEWICRNQIKGSR